MCALFLLNFWLVLRCDGLLAFFPMPSHTSQRDNCNCLTKHNMCLANEFAKLGALFCLQEKHLCVLYLGILAIPMCWVRANSVSSQDRSGIDADCIHLEVVFTHNTTLPG